MIANEIVLRSITGNLTVQQRLFIIQRYYAAKSSKRIIDEFEAKFSTVIQESTIFRIRRKFELTGTLHDQKLTGRPVKKRTVDKINEIKEIVRDNPRLSITRIAAQVNLSYSLTRSIMRDNLKLRPNKIRVSHELKEKDYELRMKHCKTMLRRLEVEGMQFFNNFYHSDESWFELTGYINSQNDRLWSVEPPNDATTAGLLHPLKVGVWAAISRSRTVGPIFFDTTVNTETYLEFINEFVNSFSSEEIDQVELQQDGAPAHTSAASMHRLYELFPPNHVILNPDWPPRSPDLSVCDNFLWSYLKNNIYKSNPRTIKELK